MKTDLAARLESFRLENKITLQELAKLLDVNYTTLYRWFSGRTTPNKIQQYHIEKFLTLRLRSGSILSEQKRVEGLKRKAGHGKR